MGYRYYTLLEQSTIVLKSLGNANYLAVAGPLRVWGGAEFRTKHFSGSSGNFMTSIDFANAVIAVFMAKANK